MSGGKSKEDRICQSGTKKKRKMQFYTPTHTLIHIHTHACVCTCVGFPGVTHGKESACQYRKLERCWFDPWVGKIPWSRNWHPTPIILPAKSHGQRRLVDYSLFLPLPRSPSPGRKYHFWLHHMCCSSLPGPSVRGNPQSTCSAVTRS